VRQLRRQSRLCLGRNLESVDHDIANLSKNKFRLGRNVGGPNVKRENSRLASLNFLLTYLVVPENSSDTPLSPTHQLFWQVTSKTSLDFLSCLGSKKDLANGYAPVHLCSTLAEG